MWIGLEINIISFIPLIVNKSNKSRSEAAIIYFLTQRVRSIIIIIIVLMIVCEYLINYKFNIRVIIISLLIKLGAAPFHIWIPKIISNIEWRKCCLLITWQKIAPLYIISNLNINTIIYLSIILSIIIGRIGGLNQTSLRKIIAYSSINHLGWILSINKSINLWISYLIIYSIIILRLCYIFYNYKLNFINQISRININNREKFRLFIIILRIGGLPPFIGFLPKWITIQRLFNENEFLIIFIIIIFRLVTLIYYLRVITNIFLSFNISIKWSLNYIRYSTIIIYSINFRLPLIIIIDVI